MASERNQNPDAICFSGALTLEHWHDVDRLGHTRRSRRLVSSYLIVAAVSSFSASVVSYQRDDVLLTVLTAIASILIGSYVLLRFEHERQDRKHRRFAAEHRLGWFAPTDWLVTDTEISYSTDMENGSHSGTIPWDCVKRAVAGERVLILYLTHPYTTAVIARDWVSVQQDWEHLLQLANASETTECKLSATE